MCHTLDSVFNLRSLLSLNLAHAKQEQKITQLFQQNIEHSYTILNFKSLLLEGSFPLSYNIVSLFHWYLKFAVYCQCDDFFFSVRLTHSALKYPFFYISSSKKQMELKFLLGTHGFQLHPFLGTCYRVSTPAKKNNNNPTSLSLATSRISQLESYICFLHLKIPILRII